MIHPRALFSAEVGAGAPEHLLRLIFPQGGEKHAWSNGNMGSLGSSASGASLRGSLRRWLRMHDFARVAAGQYRDRIAVAIACRDDK